MADDITYSGSGASVPANTKQATDEHATRGHMPIVKLGYSADGSATHVQADVDGVLVNLGANNDVTVTGSVTANAGTNLNTSALLTESDFDTKTGALTETAPATDTASSGLNGRLQRIAQRLTSLIALFPSALSNGFFKVSLQETAVAQPVTDNSGSLTVDGTVTANLAAGTNNIGDVDVLSIAAGDNNIGNVDVVTMPNVTVGTMANLTESLVDDAAFTPATSRVVPIGFEYDDTTPDSVNEGDIGAARMSANRNQYMTIRDAAGNERGVNVNASNQLSVSVDASLPAGTNAIGKLAANSGVDIGDVDITSIAAGDNNIGNVDLASAIPAGTNAIGKLLPPDIDVTAHTNYIKKYYTNAGAVTDGIIWSPASGKRWHVVSMYINVSAAATVTLEDDLAGGDSAVWKGEYAANSGITIHFGEKYPLASGEDAADLIITTSAGNVYVTVTGYEI